MTDLDALIEAVEAGNATVTTFDDAFPNAHNFEHSFALSAYRGSLDAAKRLHDALLPGWPVRVMDHSQEWLGAHGWHACVNWPHLSAPEGRPAYAADLFSYTAWASTPARAWLLSILKALKAKGEA